MFLSSDFYDNIKSIFTNNIMSFQKQCLIKLSAALGFKNFSEYALTMLCAKKPETVQTFLQRLTEKLRILQHEEMKILLDYKEKYVNLKSS